MLMRLLGQTEPDIESLIQKRKHVRRESDQCVVEINGKTYPVMNWSRGGALIFADDRQFAETDHLELTLKFHMQNQIIPITNMARVLRKAANRVAVEFQSLNNSTRQQFQKVIDDITTREFADSQI